MSTQNNNTAFPLGQRIAIVGVTCSGKTTLARRLAQMYELAHIEMDALNWQPGWQPAPKEVFRGRVDAATSAPAWVTDGNYKEARDLTWGRAQTLIWLDYPLPLTFWRLLRRTLLRILKREALWGGNRETWGNAFFSRDSLFLYQIKSHGKHRRSYPEVAALPVYRHLTLVHLRSPAELRRWLAGLERLRQAERG